MRFIEDTPVVINNRVSVSLEIGGGVEEVTCQVIYNGRVRRAADCTFDRLCVSRGMFKFLCCFYRYIGISNDKCKAHTHRLTPAEIYHTCKKWSHKTNIQDFFFR